MFKRFVTIVGLVILIIVLLAHVGRSTSPPAPVTSTSAGSAPTPTDAPFLPIYIGVPMANITSRWGHERSPGLGYMTCPTAPVFSAWHAFADPTTNRVNYIGPRNNCFPGALPWREWVRPFLPPDAELIGTVNEDGGTVAEHYFSGWLAQRLGSGDLMVRGDDDGNTWMATTGWQPFSAQ